MFYEMAFHVAGVNPRRDTEIEERKRLKQIWASIKDRCNNPKSQGYANYGGRGIKCLICSYQEFEDHIGFSPSRQHSVDRIDVNGNYAIGNIRWATPTEQAQNTRSYRLITFNGETKHISVWAKELGLGIATLQSRIAAWGIERAIKTPKLHWTEEAAKIRKARTHCKRGHEFNEGNTHFVGTWRECRKCKTLAMRAYREKGKA